MTPSAVRPFSNLDLSPAEHAFLAGCRTAEAAYAKLDASPSLEPNAANAALRVRRTPLLRSLESGLSPGFLAAVQTSRRVGPAIGGAAPPSLLAASISPPLGLMAALPPAQAEAVPFSPADIPGWPPRDQGNQGTCIAQATLACLELMGARASGAVQRLSVRFLHAQMAARPAPVPVGTPAGYMKFAQAVDVLTHLGVCHYETWPDAGDPTEPPSPAALREALAFRPQPAAQRDMKDPANRPPGTAALIHDELRQGRPVAIALPGYADPADPNLPTTWSRAEAVVYGEVPDPSSIERPVLGSGHAVCVVGFQPGGAGLLDGYFVFRNSYGLRFATHPRYHADTDPPPRVPAPGYGCISARNVDQNCWDLLSLRLPGPPGP